MSKTNLKAITILSKNSNTIAANYAAINSSGLAEACSFIVIQNDTTKDITISLDGVNDHIFIKSTARFDMPIQINQRPNANEALMPKGTIFYVKGAAGTGSVYISGFYV